MELPAIGRRGIGKPFQDIADSHIVCQEMLSMERFGDFNP
jgi:hypothetical protein